MSNGRYHRAPSAVLQQGPGQRRAGRRWAGLASAGLVAGLLLTPNPVSADPGGGDGPAAQADSHPASNGQASIRQVQHRLDVLHRQADASTEAYNAVRVRVDRAMATMTALRADLERQRTRVADLRRDLVGAALSDYTSTGGLSTSASFLLAKRPSEFINELATTALVQQQQAGLLTELTQQQNQLGVQEQQAARELAAITADRRELAGHRATIEAKIKASSRLLADLERKQRVRLRALQRAAAQSVVTQPSRGDVRPPTDPTAPVSGEAAAPVSGRAGIAVATALAQVGDPYVYGAAGPSAFDCSGLTMYAWAAAGVSLSHASSVQSGQGVAVSLSALQPGDLVFYYSPVSHVAMYIGNGQVVHAPYPGASVEVVPLYSMPVSWARRVG